MALPDHATVHEGRDGWLFLVGGTNRVLAQYRRSPATWWRARRWRRLIEGRAARCAALGARYLHAVVPEKLTVYGDSLSGLDLRPGLAPAFRLARALEGSPAAGCWVDLAGVLREARDGAELYFRTDTHWTFAGCHLAYEALCRAAGIAPRADLAGRPFVEGPMLRDLGDKLDPPRTEICRSYNVRRDAVRVEVNPLLAAYEAAGLAQELHVGAQAAFRNDAAEAAPLRVVLFGDSCAHFDPMMLTGMLAETVRELHFVWSARLDLGYVARVRPDIVVGEIAERFLARVPTDDLDLEAYGAARLAEFAASGAQRRVV